MCASQLIVAVFCVIEHWGTGVAERALGLCLDLTLVLYLMPKRSANVDPDATIAWSRPQIQPI